jgi:hypothetical protein
LHKPAVLLALAAGLASPAAAQLKPNSPEAIASAATDCWSAAGPRSLDEARLRQLGWAAGSIKSPGGKDIDTPLRVYSKRGSNVVMMVMNSATMSGCTILSRVAKAEEIGVTAQLLLTKLTAIDPTVKGSRQGQSILYFALPRVAELAPTGTIEQPATRIVVGYTSSEKK